MAEMDWGALLEGLSKGYVTGTNIQIAKAELTLKKKADKIKQEEADQKIFETMQNVAVPAKAGTPGTPEIPGTPSRDIYKQPAKPTFDPFSKNILSLAEYQSAPSAPSVSTTPGTGSILPRIGTPPRRIPIIPATSTIPAVPAVETTSEIPATPLTVEQIQRKRAGITELGVEYKPITQKVNKGTYNIKLVDVAGLKPDRVIGTTFGTGDVIKTWNSKTGESGADPEILDYTRVYNANKSSYALAQKSYENAQPEDKARAKAELDLAKVTLDDSTDNLQSAISDKYGKSIPKYKLDEVTTQEETSPGFIAKFFGSKPTITKKTEYKVSKVGESQSTQKKTAEQRFNELISQGKTQDEAYKIVAQEGY